MEIAQTQPNVHVMMGTLEMNANFQFASERILQIHLFVLEMEIVQHQEIVRAN
jgi:hypothetical protein